MEHLQQFGHVGSEISRDKAKNQGNRNRMWNTLTRALELFDLTIAPSERNLQCT